MINVTFVTGNQRKADFMAKYLNHPIDHKKVHLEEIQSLDIHEVVKHKVKQAYGIIDEPVLVEDISLSFNAIGSLPGVFIRWFLSEVGNEGMCRMLDIYTDRTAIAKVCFAYYDGSILKIFEGQVEGEIADKPMGDDSFGWNCIFIPNGANKTYAQMNGEETKEYSLRTATVFPEIKKFLEDIDKK